MQNFLKFFVFSIKEQKAQMGMAFRGTKTTFLTVRMSGILLKVLFIAPLAYILIVHY